MAEPARSDRLSFLVEECERGFLVEMRVLTARDRSISKGRYEFERITSAAKWLVAQFPQPEPEEEPSKWFTPAEPGVESVTIPPETMAIVRAVERLLCEKLEDWFDLTASDHLQALTEEWEAQSEGTILIDEPETLIRIAARTIMMADIARHFPGWRAAQADAWRKAKANG